MQGRAVIDALATAFSVTTDKALARRLGITTVAMRTWRKRPRVTSRQVASLARRSHTAGARTAQATAMRPLVEFFRIQKCPSKHGVTYELFSSKTSTGLPHKYRAGLRQELEAHHGVYLFFDSRGQAIYAGKARRQSLWKEMNLAFNRDRGDVQKIKRVRHPEKQVRYRKSDEKARQIKEYIVPLHELAAYVSAYHVADGMINSLEALLVRSFANDLLNTRMERFGQQKKTNKQTKKQRTKIPR